MVRIGLVVVTAGLLAGLTESLLVVPDYRLVRLAVSMVALGLSLADLRYGVLALIALAPLLTGVTGVALGAYGLSLGQHVLVVVAFVAATRTLASRRPAAVRSAVDVPLLLFVSVICLTTWPTLVTKIRDVAPYLHTTLARAAAVVTEEAVTPHFFFRLEHWQRPHAWAVHDALVAVEGALVFWLVRAPLSDPRGRRTRAALAFAAAGVVAIGIVQWFFPFHTDTRYTQLIQPNLFRINASLPDPNTLGAFLVLVSPLAAVVVLQRFPIRRLAPAAAVVWGAVAAWCLILTDSRAAIVAFLTVLLATLVVVALRPRTLGLTLGRRARAAAASAVTVIVTGTVATSLHAMHGGLPEHVTYQTVASRAEMAMLTLDLRRPFDVIVTGRPQHWRPAIRMWRDALWLGQGIGRYVLLKNDYLPADEQLPLHHSPHCFYLKVLAETGIVGVCLLAALLAAVAVQARRAWRAADRPGRLRVFAIAAGLASFLIAMIVGEPIMVLEMQYAFWTLVGLLVVEQREARPTT